MILDPWVRDIKSTEQVVENSERGDEAKASTGNITLDIFFPSCTGFCRSSFFSSLNLNSKSGKKACDCHLTDITFR